MAEKQLLDLSQSSLVLEGTEKQQQEWAAKISRYEEALRPDRTDRKNIYAKRRDFYTGNQGDYSNIIGVVKDVKNKKGHVNQITNYAGKTCVKIAYGLANNPPKLTIPPLDATNETETIRAQAVQDRIDDILKSRENQFWKKTYRRCCFNQVELGDAAFRCYPQVEEKKICIVPHDDMGSLMVGWNGYDPEDFDFVVAEMMLTPDKIREMYGIIVNEKLIPQAKIDQDSRGSWDHNNEWGTKGSPSKSTNILPSGKTNLAKLKVVEFDSTEAYGIKIEEEMVELVFKDDQNYPRVKIWTLVHNIPNPPSSWSIADIDYLIDAQIELNDNDNRTADYLRVGGVQRYVAYNMTDFDPESIKTSSGQVIFVNDPDGKSRFEPLQTNVNNFPSDTYHNRKMGHIYDMGLPKVNYGASGADSGRSKAIDYQSSVDLTLFKRDAWELALQDLVYKIQVFDHFLHPELDFYNDVNGEFVVRDAEFDWTDIVPITQSDKIVNVANKFNMIGIPFEQAYKELGYRNPKAMVQTLIKELEDPKLMTLRSKMWQLSQGILEAQNQASTMSMSNASETMGPQQGAPMLTSDQNQSAPQPMASQIGTSVTTPSGAMGMARQNLQARGKA